MSRHLCISVTFLDWLFHGKGVRHEPEWPPSPLRLFQALLAGARAGCRERDWSDAKVDAFRWLERRNPPEIITPVARQVPGYTLFVPNNDSDKKLERNARLTSKDARPHRMIGGHTLHYLWPISEEEWPKVESLADTLRVEARHLLVLGWGIDSIVGNGSILTVPEADALTGVRWQPWPGLASSHHQRRVPIPGTLDDLRDAYMSFLCRLSGNIYQPPREPRVFDYVTYLKLSAFPPRPYAAFLLEGALGASRRATFRQADVVRVAAMLRHLACEAAKTDSRDFPGGSERYVAGHTTDRNDRSPRFSIYRCRRLDTFTLMA